MSCEQYRVDSAEWTELPIRVPSRSDFDENISSADLDAEYAWKNFGSLTLPQAYVRFCERPDVYQEDFMFMGARAFAFYFPVVERFLFEFRARDEFDDGQAWILACGIKEQLESKFADAVTHLAPRVKKLADHVLADLGKFSILEEEQLRIAEAWRELQTVATAKQKTN